MSDNDKVTTQAPPSEVISLFHVVTYADGSPIERDPKHRYACTPVAMDDVEGGDDHSLRQTA